MEFAQKQLDLHWILGRACTQGAPSNMHQATPGEGQAQGPLGLHTKMQSL